MTQLSPQLLLNKLGLEYDQRGSRLALRCPFHDDHRPSSSFYLDSNKFYCFSCEITYDPVTFYAKFRDIPFSKAASTLEREFELPEMEKPSGDFGFLRKKFVLGLREQAFPDSPSQFKYLELLLKVEHFYREKAITAVKAVQMIEEAQQHLRLLGSSDRGDI